MEEAKLKPCPFCGGEAAILSPRKTSLLNKNTKRPFCTKCGATMFVWAANTKAIEDWNRRV